jgi:hypothetical protein
LSTFSAAAAASAQVTLNVPLASTLSFPTSNTLLWMPGQGGAELSNLLSVLIAEQVQRVRLRVHLAGAAVWFVGAGSRIYLDGCTLTQDGFRADGTPRIDLLLPSGDGRRASNFDSWLYVQLQLPPSTLIAVAIAPPLINAGGSATGTVTLDHPAPADGITVALASSSVNVTATFGVTTDAPSNTLSAIVSATATGVTLTAALTVQLVSVVLSPAEVTIFVGHSQQVLATVSGTSNPAVTWSVQEAGASVSASGLFFGAALGDYHVVATSVADTTRSAAALVHVRPKVKDKEKEKEKDKEVEKIIFRETKVLKEVEAKITKESKEAELLHPFVASADTSAAATGAGEPAAGSAFIPAALRPKVE